MPNLFAYVMLFLWPVIGSIVKRKFPLEDAVILLIVVPYLLLPVRVAYDPPLLPGIDKSSIASIVAFLLLFKIAKAKRSYSFTRFHKLCFALIFFGSAITILSNGDNLVFRQSYLPGLKAGDVIGVLFIGFTGIFVPFYLGYHLLSTANAHRRLIYWIAALGLIYMLPVFWEVRMSPQLHTQIYGFFPHDFGQQARSGGFRPVVFLGHGLLVAFFSFSACIAAFVLMKSKIPVWKLSGLQAFIIILIGVILCKTLSALIYLIGGLVLIWLVKPKKQFLIASLLGIMILSYPLIREYIEPSLRSFSVLVKEYEEDRSGSLEFRLNNENALLEKANQRPWFGWGTWGRNHVYDEDGRAVSVTDGVWIIVFGVWGWVGYVGFFGLVCTPFIYWSFLLRRGSGFKDPIESIEYSAALAIILIANLIDLIPNSSLSHLTVLTAGALVGRAISLQQEQGSHV